MDSVEELSNKLKQFVKERDWGQFHNPTQLAMDISVEASELLELFQWKKENELSQVLIDKKDKIEDELGDVFLSCLKFANETDINILAAANKKFLDMERKYPIGKSKGQNKKYTEL